MKTTPARSAVDQARAALGAAIAGARAPTTGREPARIAQGRQSVQTAMTALQRAMRDYLGDDPSVDLERLDARYPIALFPVRVETRFDAPSSSLRIRVYPDEILADAHDPSLTVDEQELGARFWAESTSLGPATAWQHLLGVSAAPRAAWIVRTTDPAATAPPTLRAHSWSRPVNAPLLPDRWIAIAYRGGKEIARATSTAVIEPLALTVDPTAPTSQNIDISGGAGLTLDPGVVWTVDYATATAAGMAFALPLAAADFAAGCDRLLVFGVKSSVDPDAAADAVAQLFDAQHYSRGWAFVPQGTPTNDSRDAPSGFPAPDVNGTASFAVERGGPLAAAGTDGPLWAQAFGLRAEVVDHVRGADGTEQVSAAAMTRALFSATWGYFLDTMLASTASTTTIDELREYMVGAVRARGPLPAFRVGGVPYGVLPVSSLTRWHTSGQDIDSQLPQVLRTAQSIWIQKVAAAPHIGRSTDADGDLLDIMSMDASARAIRLRKVLGADAQWNLLTFLGTEWSGWSTSQRALAATVLGPAGFAGLDAPIVSAVLADDAPRFKFGFVTDTPVSQSDALNPNYITWIRNASIADLQGERFSSMPHALLYRLLRYAVLTDTWREGRRIILANGSAAAVDLREHELIGIVPGTERRPTPWDHFAQPVSAVTHTLTLGQYLSPIQSGEPFRTLPPPLVSLRDALLTLETLPTAELERLTTETLDLASSRLDAWITSLYTKRLATLRTAQPTGLHVGAFAWLEDVRPDTQIPRPSPEQPAVRVARAQAAASGSTLPQPVRISTGGYIHAPSMTHAAAAAVLRNGFLTNGATAAAGAPTSPYAINLTSARVRAARFVLEAVQQGQAVGAIFGYQVERGLHDAKIEILIEPLRTMYPIVANKAVDSGQPAEVVAARNVVDGLRLRTAWTGGTIPWGSGGLPASGPQRTALETILAALDDTVDAVADLLLAESVFQLVRGSTAGTSATLDALAQGVRPPDPGISHPLRGGTDLTHRVAIVIGGAPLTLPAGWPSLPTPRAAAEPRLDAWVGTILGNPSNAKCRVSYPDPTLGDPTRVTSVEVTLDMLAVRPLDVLAMSGAERNATQASDLDRRLVFAALGDVAPPAGPPTVDYTRAAGWDRATVRTIPEVLELAQAASRVIGGARPMEPQDFVRPADASEAIGTGIAVAEAEARATAAETALGGAVATLASALSAVPASGEPTAVEVDALRVALRAASMLGVPAAYPVPGAGLVVGGVDPTVLAQATSVLSELRARQVKAADAHLPATPMPTDAARVAAAAAIAAAIFGRDFVFVAGCTPPPASTMAGALSESAALVGDPHVVAQWLQSATRVRDPLARWRYLRLLGESGGAAPPALAVVQLPLAAGARWGALPFASPADRAAGRLSLVMDRAASPTATEPWYALLVDQWVELIPNATESTGLAFRYDDPGAEAAQAVLLAVPPTLVTERERWDLDSLIDTLNETLDLAKMRAVDLSLLGDLGQLLPAIYFTANENDDAITIKWDDAFRAETTLDLAAHTVVSSAGGKTP
jgi:hypothetical protein